MTTDERSSREQSLRRAVLRGEEAAWNELYRGTFRSLYAFVYHRTHRHRERSDEVVQETWMIAVQRIRSFDPLRAPFEAWVRGIALNVLKNRSRQWSKQELRSRELDPPVDTLETDLPPLRLELAEQIALAMTELPARYQRVLRARYEQQHTVGEIARRCGLTPKAAESLLGRARAAFRAAFDRLDPDHATERP